MDALFNKIYKFYRLDYSQDFNLSATKSSLSSSKGPTTLSLVFFQTLLLITIFSEKTIASQYSELEYFIEFQLGNYQQHSPNSLEPLLRSLEQAPNNQPITLTGYSESRTSFASEQLALNRAEIIKKLLVKKGYSASRIKTNSYYENHKAEGELLHGVFATTASKLNTVDTSELNSHEHNQPKKNLKFIGFIEFQPSNYDQENPGDKDKILSKITLLPSASAIKVVGISQSKTFLATHKLALQRAQIVAKSLIAEGIESERIQQDSEVTNHVEDNYLIHGVRIYADIENNELTVESVSANQLSPKTPNNNNKISTEQTLDDVIKQLNQNAKASTLSTSNTAKPADSNKKSCSELEIKKGSLKKNIQREITDCGYQMGQWNFGTNEEYIDWLIPIAYKVQIEKGIFGVLRTIETNYQIRAHVHQLDRSIDFLPSINRDKGQ